MLPYILQKSTGAIKKSSRQRAGGHTSARQSAGTLFCVLDAVKKSHFVFFFGCMFCFVYGFCFAGCCIKKAPFRGMMVTAEKKEYICMFSKNLNSHKVTAALWKEKREKKCSGRKWHTIDALGMPASLVP
jgi:hypothetical protein